MYFCIRKNFLKSISKYELRKQKIILERTALGNHFGGSYCYRLSVVLSEIIVKVSFVGNLCYFCALFPLKERCQKEENILF